MVMPFGKSNLMPVRGAGELGSPVAVNVTFGSTPLKPDSLSCSVKNGLGPLPSIPGG
jgi:hypothetical protein